MKKVIFTLVCLLISVKAFAQADWLKGTAWEYQTSCDKQVTCVIKDFVFHPNGKFEVFGMPLPSSRHEGQYKIVQASPDGNELKLELSQHKGDLGNWKSQIAIKRNKDGTLTIDGEGPYQRLKYIPKPKHQEPNEH
ncbi:MAG: hypothetical protein HYU97_05565 [Deltaproteobacteria bacterium]|nr:hypothetical protein [Deltaproteobacteria bacterium]